MKQQTKESISALLDNELQKHQIGRTLDRVEGADELRQTWDRYHLIGDIMRGEGVRISTAGVADQVREQIDREPAILAAPRPAGKILFGRHWLKPAAGAAMAASVAAITIVALPRFSGVDPGLETGQLAAVPINRSATVPVQLAAAPAPINNYGKTRGTRWKNLQQPSLESRLNRFLVDHNEYAAAGGISGIMPYATFVSYDSSRP